MRSPFLGFGSEEALRHIADALADGLFTTDAEGRVTYWNDAAERITGWSRAEALGATCSILAGDTENGCTCGVGPIRCGLALSGRSSKQCTIRTKDNRRRVIVKAAVPIRDANGEMIGALESFTAVGNGESPEVSPDGDFFGLVGRHPLMQELYRVIGLVAASSATVMITGESGSGKQRVAEIIHLLSSRRSRPFVRIPCAALEQILADAGDGRSPARGTGEEHGPLEHVSGGTLLLDELGDISPAAQVKLLHLLEQREVRRARDPSADVGDFRVLCTTHGDLRSMVDAGRLRADLYFRLNVFPVRVPSLRDHPEDVPLIAQRWLARSNPSLALAPDAARALAAHAWPGNVRELQNVLEFATVHAGVGPITLDHLPGELRPAAKPAQRDEREVLAEALLRCGGNRTLAARELGISRVTLWKRMKRHGGL